jgi:hypothetical protein
MSGETVGNTNEDFFSGVSSDEKRKMGLFLCGLTVQATQ